MEHGHQLQSDKYVLELKHQLSMIINAFWSLYYIDCYYKICHDFACRRYHYTKSRENENFFSESKLCINFITTDESPYEYNEQTGSHYTHYYD